MPQESQFLVAQISQNVSKFIVHPPLLCYIVAEKIGPSIHQLDGAEQASLIKRPGGYWPEKNAHKRVRAVNRKKQEAYRNPRVIFV